MATPITYAQIKTAMTAMGLEVSAGSGWTAQDQKQYDEQYVPSVSYMKEAPDVIKANYGFVFAGEMPEAIVEDVGAASYTATVAVTPLVGNIPLNVAATATEPGIKADSYLWHWSDGTADTTTTVPTANHTYTIAGSVTPTMTPTVDGQVKAAVPATAPVVVSGAYSATLAGAPLTGAHAATPVVWTLTETNNPTGTDSYLWDFGDTTTQTTAVPTATKTYAAAGTFTAKCTPTINGVAHPQVTATAPAVLT